MDDDEQVVVIVGRLVVHILQECHLVTAVTLLLLVTVIVFLPQLYDDMIINANFMMIMTNDMIEILNQSVIKILIDREIFNRIKMDSQ